MNTKVLVARKQHDLTQVELAKRTGLQQTDISRIEKSGWIPPVAVRDRLAEALETTAAELFEVGDAVASQGNA